MKTDNELIAEFMGGDISTGWVTFQTPPSSLFQNYNWDVEHLAYHKSWDWLMPVVEKIERLCEQKELEFPETKDLSDPTGWRAWSYHRAGLSTNIEQVYKNVVFFIKWYNENKSS